MCSLIQRCLRNEKKKHTARHVYKDTKLRSMRSLMVFQRSLMTTWHAYNVIQEGAGQRRHRTNNIGNNNYGRCAIFAWKWMVSRGKQTCMACIYAKTHISCWIKCEAYINVATIPTHIAGLVLNQIVRASARPTRLHTRGKSGLKNARFMHLVYSIHLEYFTRLLHKVFCTCKPFVWINIKSIIIFGWGKSAFHVYTLHNINIIYNFHPILWFLDWEWSRHTHICGGVRVRSAVAVLCYF